MIESFLVIYRRYNPITGFLASGSYNLSTLPPLLSQYSQNLRCRSCAVDVTTGAWYSMITCSLHFDQLGVSKTSLYVTKKSLFDE